MTLATGRFTARLDGDFVVFPIGVRINKPRLRTAGGLVPVQPADPRERRRGGLPRDPPRACGAYEAVYVDVPRMGLAAATEHVPVGSTSTAARRLGQDDTGGPPVAP